MDEIRAPLHLHIFLKRKEMRNQLFMIFTLDLFLGAYTKRKYMSKHEVTHLLCVAVEF